MRHPMRAIRELDCVVLTADSPGNGLAAGDIGTVVHVLGGEEAFEVEFADQDEDDCPCDPWAHAD